MNSAYHSYQDIELLQLIALNDVAAFSEIYKRYSAEMFLTAYGILRHREGAEDAVQEIFTSLWNRRLELNIQSLKGYLVQSVRYFVLRVFKEGKRDEAFYNRLALVTSAILQDDPVLYRNIHQTLQKIISTLPEDQRHIFQMNRDQNLSYAEIAKRLNISVKTVEKKMSKSLKIIRFQMNNLLVVLM